LAKGHEHLVAGAVAKIVIDDLEIVDVQEQHRKRLLAVAPLALVG
jgi:hypothetical protein